MERLTIKITDGNLAGEVIPEVVDGSKIPYGNLACIEILNRLSEYEDTNLTPAEITAYEKLRQGYSVDGKTMGELNHGECLDFIKAMMWKVHDLTAGIEAMKAENRKLTAEIGAIHTIFTRMSNCVFNYSQYQHIKKIHKDNPSEPIDWMIDFCKEYENYTGKCLDIHDFREE